jgi:hypothetical protein
MYNGKNQELPEQKYGVYLRNVFTEFSSQNKLCYFRELFETPKYIVWVNCGGFKC